MDKLKIKMFSNSLRNRLKRLQLLKQRKKRLRQTIKPKNRYRRNRVINKPITDTKKLQFKQNNSINITIKSNKPLSIYYNKDKPATMQYNKYKYIRTTDHKFTITDNLANDLYITIIRTSDTTYSCDIVYEENLQNKYAIIVGISDYRNISDLNFCDEDATDWTNYLSNIGYNCFVFGDGHTKNYPQYNGLATEQNVRTLLKKIAEISDNNTKLAYVTSGHGAGDNNGNSFLCMYDYTGLPNGKYTDKEFYNDIKQVKGQKFVFFDHCASGGMLDELKNVDNIFATSTCTEKGFGWDMSKYKNGAWTHCFLEKAINGQYNNTSTSLNQLFDYASNIFKTETGQTSEFDQPMKISSNDNMYL